MEQDLENIIIAEGPEEDIEAAILLNILREPEGLNFHNTPKFNLENFSDEECKFLFRFKKADIQRLARVLRLPQFIRSDKLNKVTDITGLCMLLRRLAYPNRLNDLKILFGYSAQSLSLLLNKVLRIIEENHKHLLENLNMLPWLNQARLETYAHAVQEKGGAVTNCWGFIDGTARAICRPTIDQENYYSGHKRFHCLIYQSVLCPDGIIVSLLGAWPGRRHDAAILAESGLYTQLENVTIFPNKYFTLFGDQAYGVRQLLLAPYRNTEHMERHHRQFNASMKVLRVAVEWGFGKVQTEFSFLNFKKNQKLLLQELTKMYKVGVLLTNCHTCLYGSQTSQYFNVNPPSLETYIGFV